MRTRCPNCGLSHDVDEPKPKLNTFENRVRRHFRTDAAAVSMPQQGVVSQTPAGLPNRETHVAVPFDQAKITGFFAGPVGGVVVYIAVSVIDAAPTLEITPWGKVAAVVCGTIATGFSVAGLMWLKRLSVYDGLLWIEEITGLDLNGDEQIGEPPVNKVEVEITKNGIPRQIEEFETDLERFRALAQLVLIYGKSFSEETASEAGYTRKEWVKIRDKFIGRKYAVWSNTKHHKQGVSLARLGVAILQKFLPPTLPVAGMPQNSPAGTNVGEPTNALSGNLYEKYEHI